MSNESRFVTESLEELLVSIAEGVREAQDALNNAPPVDSFGRPLATYHLPYLDFELHVEMDTTSSSSNRLWVKPIGSSSSSERSVGSKISGRLVSVPPGDGLPIPALAITSKVETVKNNKISYKISVAASNSAGEILASQAIELNINTSVSKRLSEADGISLPDKLKGVSLADVMLVTDESGFAETIFNLSIGTKKIPLDASVVLNAFDCASNLSFVSCIFFPGLPASAICLSFIKIL